MPSLTKALPSFLLAGWIFRFSQSNQASWTFLPNTLFALATLWTLTSFHFLGKSFAILPAVRGLITHGPYRWIRHPAYLGELILVLACCLAAQSTLAWILFACLLPSLILRIRAEEHLLATNLESFTKYQAKVPWRLFPGIW